MTLSTLGSFFTPLVQRWLGTRFRRAIPTTMTMRTKKTTMTTSRTTARRSSESPTTTNRPPATARLLYEPQLA